MTIKFNKTEGLKAAQEKMRAALLNAESTPEEQTSAMQAYMEELQNSVATSVRNQVNDEMLDRSILQQRGQNVLTAEETKFFAAVANSGGFSDDSILPVTTQERVFDDLVQEHPLLAEIGLENLGAVTRYIDADPTKAYAWGDLFGGIAGQVATAFSESTVGQLKLTSFAAIPNDIQELGPIWIERYVRTLLAESYSFGLEFGFVNGGGTVAKQPVGLTKNVDPDTGAVTAKTAIGTLTFAPSQYGEVVAGELYNVVKALSTDADDKAIKVNNKVVMVVNPVDEIAVQMRNTIQTANGQWVTALPYNIKVVPSEEIAIGKALFFVKGRYKARLSGGIKVKKFDQTLAIEDATLYTLKQFANGEPKDNKAALLYDLNITFAPLTTTTTTGV